MLTLRSLHEETLQIRIALVVSIIEHAAPYLLWFVFLYQLDVVLKMIQEAEENGGLDKLVGKTITNQDQIRMVPDILQNGDEFFFPVFSTAEDMGKYGESFSKVQRHFLEAVNLARNNKKKVTGIVINAFTEPFVMPMELLDIIAEMDSAIENPENE